MTAGKNCEKSFDFLCNFMWDTFRIYIRKENTISIDDQKIVFRNVVKVREATIESRITIWYDGYVTVDMEGILKDNPLRRAIWKTSGFQKIVLNKLTSKYPGRRLCIDFGDYYIKLPIVVEHMGEIIDYITRTVYEEIKRLEEMIINTLISNPDLVNSLIMYEEATKISQKIKS